MKNSKDQRLFRETWETYVKKLAQRDIKKALEKIIVMVIHNRCSKNAGKEDLKSSFISAENGKIEIFQHIAAKEWLKQFGDCYGNIHPYSVDLLMTLGSLDQIASSLQDNSCYLINSERLINNLFQKLKHIEDYIAEITKAKKADNLPLSGMFTSAEKFFTDHVESLRAGADVSNNSQYPLPLFSLLRRMGRKLKLGTLHQMVTDMQIGAEKLTNRHLTGHTFYDHVDNPQSYTALPPAGPDGRIEDRVKRVMDPMNNEDMETFTDNIGTISSVFFSPYFPELSGSGDSSQPVIVFDNIDQFHILEHCV